jgi:hypothetical protein
MLTSIGLQRCPFILDLLKLKLLSTKSPSN